MQSLNKLSDDQGSSWADHWQPLLDFFFPPSNSHTLALIRIFTGSMIAYIHLVWMLDLEAFMGPRALIDNAFWHALHREQMLDAKWTYLARIDSMPLIWTHEILAMIAGLLLALGLKTRIVSILAWFLTLMTVHRMTGMLFGLDQIVIMLSMYLCIGRSGDSWSVDAWLLRRSSGQVEQPEASWSNTFATRWIQLHLCVIYLFGGIGKMRGDMWWDGSAMWYSAAAYEYQSWDLTWIGYSPMLASILTHMTVFWELSYCALIWPKWTRPIMLGIALMVHGGIAIYLGMITFGFMMLVANLAFVSPKRLFDWSKVFSKVSRER